MTDLVTLEQVKRRLRIDGTREDLDLADMIAQASAMVLRYLKYGKTTTDEDDEEVPILDFSGGIPADVQLAALITVGEIMKEREADVRALSQGVVDILAPYRDPTLA